MRQRRDTLSHDKSIAHFYQMRYAKIVYLPCVYSNTIRGETCYNAFIETRTTGTQMAREIEIKMFQENMGETGPRDFEFEVTASFSSGEMEDLEVTCEGYELSLTPSANDDATTELYEEYRDYLASAAEYRAEMRADR